MTSSILDPAALCASLPTLLPLDSKKLNSPQDGIAALIHTALSTLAFRLIGVDESSTSASSSSNALPTSWNQHGPAHYTFKYKHDQSSLEFIVKLTKLGSRTLINAIAAESDKAASLDIATNDFVSPSFYPHDLASADAQPLVHGFISSNRVTDLMSSLQLQIIQKLIPGLRKDGYTESSNEPSNVSGSNPPRTRPEPARPNPQGPSHPPESSFPSRSHIPPENPLSIGRSDLDPFPGINPFAPPPLFPGGPQGGGGMFVGPDHPIFGGRNPGGVEGRGPWGGDGFLPPMGAPPGARFDPVNPFSGGIGGIPGRGRGSGGPLGGPRPGGIRDPDNDEFMPPGMGDMFS